VARTPNDEIGFGLAWVAGRADLADTDADDVVQPLTGLAVGQVEHCPDDPAASRWVGAAIAVPLHHDHGAVVGLDDGAEVGPEGPFRAVAAWEVRAAEPPGDRALAASLGDKEQLLPAAVQADRPALGVGEADAIQRLKPHQLLLQAISAQVVGLAGAMRSRTRRAKGRPNAAGRTGVSDPGGPLPRGRVRQSDTGDCAGGARDGEVVAP
jgi:hypothetical protein